MLIISKRDTGRMNVPQGEEGGGITSSNSLNTEGTKSPFHVPPQAYSDGENRGQTF